MIYKTRTKALSFLLTLAMVVGLLPGMGMTAYAAGGGTEVTQANVICQQYSYMDAGSYSGGVIYDTPPADITNIALADAQAFGAASNCPTTYWVVVYAKDGDNLKWTSNGKTGEQTSTPRSASGRVLSAWCELYNEDVFHFDGNYDPNQTVTFYFSKGLATVGVTGVSLDKTTAQTIELDGKVSFTASINPANATDKKVKWSVDGTDTGAVKLYTDEDCTTEVGADATETLTVYAKGISAGSATVTATSNADSEKKASCDVTVNAAQTQAEELLTTITATGKEQASYSVENVATVSFSYTAGGSSAYTAIWGWWGYGWSATVTPAEGYTITKCVFYDDEDRTGTDSEVPFEVKTTEEDKTPQVNGTPILAYTSKGIKKIEVYGYATPTATHSVTITAGDHMTKTADSGEAEQAGLTGAMTDVVYTADNGYYFPTTYSVAAVNGISVTRDSYTQITVSGTPTADAAIALTAPTAKTTPAAPTTAAATDCTTADNNDGTLTGVTTAMEYKKSDAADWTAGTGSDITGLVPGTYYVRVKATDTTNASGYQELTIKSASTPSSSSSHDRDDGSGSSSSTSSGTTTTTTTTDTTSNPDASTTDGAKTVTTTTNRDGSTTEKTTETATKTGGDGSKTEVKAESSTTTKSNTDGTTTAATTAATTATTTAADGTKTVTETKTEAKETLDKSGNGTVEAKTTETVKDASGKVTATTVTESKGTVSTATDGTKTTTTTNTAVTTAADGTKTTVVTTEKAVETTDGNTGKVVSDESGKVVSVEAKVSETAAENAAKSGEAVTLPVTVTAAQSAENATAVAITVPKAAESVKVEIPVEDVKPGTVAVIVHEDGTEEIVKTSTTSEGGVVLALESGASVKIVDNTKTFNDVDGDEWYAGNVAWASSREVMNGVGNNTFAPNEVTTTGMLAQILMNLSGETANPDAAAQKYSDIKASDWFAAPISWLTEAGIAQGKGDEFGATEAITRERDIVLLHNYAQHMGYDTSARADLNRFADAGSVSDWARDAMAWAVGAGIINGTTDGSRNVVLDPQGSATRAQVTAMTERFCKKTAR